MKKKADNWQFFDDAFQGKIRKNFLTFFLGKIIFRACFIYKMTDFAADYHITILLIKCDNQLEIFMFFVVLIFRLFKKNSGFQIGL